MNKYLTYAVLIMSMCLFTACPSDDDETDDYSGSKINDSFVGFWKINGVKKSTQKKGTDVYFAFLKEGKMKISTGEHNSSPYSKEDYSKWFEWSYDDKTKLLVTTASVNDISFQWEVTLIGSTQWAGIGLWEAESASTVANPCSEYEILLTMLLTGQKWVKEDDSSKKIRTNYDYGFDIRDYKDEYKRIFPATYNIGIWEKIVYNKERDSISRNYSNRDPSYTITISLLHPFSQKDMRLIIYNSHDSENSGSYKLIY